MLENLRKRPSFSSSWRLVVEGKVHHIRHTLSSNTPSLTSFWSLALHDGVPVEPWNAYGGDTKGDDTAGKDSADDAIASQITKQEHHSAHQTQQHIRATVAGIQRRLALVDPEGNSYLDSSSVDNLIRQASGIDNLSLMPPIWFPWI